MMDAENKNSMGERKVVNTKWKTKCEVTHNFAANKPTNEDILALPRMLHTESYVGDGG